MPPASVLAPHPAPRAIAAKSAPFVTTDFMLIVHLPSVRLHSSTAFGKTQTLYMLCRLPVEVSLNELRFCKRIQGEPETVTAHARGARHFLVRSQIVVLVMLHEHAFTPAFLALF